jgi:CBS-domain-containing membrane protein
MPCNFVTSVARSARVNIIDSVVALNANHGALATVTLAMASFLGSRTLSPPGGAVDGLDAHTEGVVMFVVIARF